MNLQKLFKTQAELDKKIVEEKGLQGQDLLDKKILALQVELGELANEHRGFKFWSEDQKARGQAEYLEYRCKCEGGNRWVSKNPLLEEYVDCLHFILSIGLELGQEDWEPYFSKVAVHFGGDELTTQFNEVFRSVSNLRAATKDHKAIVYSSVFGNFLGLGEMLGFTWEQIEQAYYAKNKINHERQENGY